MQVKVRVTAEYARKSILWRSILVYLPRSI